MICSEKILNIKESSTAEMRNKARKLKENGLSVINFAAGELDFTPGEHIKNAAIQAIKGQFNRYTDTLGIESLREKIAEKISFETSVNYSSQEIAVTSGAKQALFNSLFCLLNNDDEVIIPIPFWVTFSAQVELCGAKPVFINTSENEFQIDINKLEQLITLKTKAIILNTPNNPTGVIYHRDTLREIGRLAIKYDFYIIFDECYRDISYLPFVHSNIVSILPELKDRTIIINSFSKSAAITGWRIGYLAGPKSIISAIKVLQGHSTSNACNIAQYAGLGTFCAEQKNSLSNIMQHLKARKTRALDILTTIPDISFIEPQGAFYFFINVSKYFSKKYKSISINNVDNLALLLLEYAKVAFVSGAGFGNNNYIRMSFSVAIEDIEIGLFSFKQFLEETI